MFSSFLTRALCQNSAPTTPDTQHEVPIQMGLVKSLVAGRTIAAASATAGKTEEGDSCTFGSPHYFALCGMGGTSPVP
jgi:hypothetical protein